MKEGETVEIQETREPLREQGSIPGIAGTFGTTGHGAGKRGCAPYGRLY